MASKRGSRPPAKGRTPGRAQATAKATRAALKKRAAAVKAPPRGKHPAPRLGVKRPRVRPRLAGLAAAPGTTVMAWEDDPRSGGDPIERPAPDLTAGLLKARLAGAEIPAGRYSKETPEFRRWAASDALDRALEYWGGCVPAGTKFKPGDSDTLPVDLEAGGELNAYYERDNGLRFHNGLAGGTRVYSAESADIVLHETGHAVLDALRPELYHSFSIEHAAFHEAFGDISALLVGLRLPSFREAVLAETGGVLYRTSRLSRLAESLGWARRQLEPDKVAPDCLRNAVNSFRYRNPLLLPTDGPYSELTAAPHNFARVFVGGFLEAVSGMCAVEGNDSAALERVSLAAGRMIVEAVRGAPVVPRYFASVAGAVADAALPAHRDSVTSALVRRGLLPVARLGGVKPAPLGLAAVQPGEGSASGVEEREVDGERVGLRGIAIQVSAPTSDRLIPVVSFAAAAQPLLAEQAPDEATLFAEQLFRRGRVDTRAIKSRAFFHNRHAHKTHRLVGREGRFTCRRVSFDCGWGD